MSMVMTMAGALRQAAMQFRSYEEGHREKIVGNPNPQARAEYGEKAETNAGMALMCEQALEHNGGTFQRRVAGWMLQCFNAVIAADKVERGDRFLEEVFELLQWMGYDFGRIAAVRDYVAARPVGEGHQEVGGVMVCLAALCSACGLDLGASAETELERIMDPETMIRIRAKQEAKPKMSPLPQ